jgi:hypothetical protein
MLSMSPEKMEQMKAQYGEEITAAGVDMANGLFEEAEKVLKTASDAPHDDQIAELRDLAMRLLCSLWVHDAMLRVDMAQAMRTAERVNALEAEVRKLRYKVARLNDPLNEEPAEEASAPDFLTDLESALRDAAARQANS